MKQREHSIIINIINAVIHNDNKVQTHFKYLVVFTRPLCMMTSFCETIVNKYD